MKIIHQGGYKKEELELYRLTVYKNLVDCAKALIGAMRQFEIEPKLDGNDRYVEFISSFSIDPDPHSTLDPRIGEAITSLWKDPCIANVLEHQTEFYLMDSAP